MSNYYSDRTPLLSRFYSFFLAVPVVSYTFLEVRIVHEPFLLDLIPVETAAALALFLLSVKTVHDFLKATVIEYSLLLRPHFFYGMILVVPLVSYIFL